MAFPETLQSPITAMEVNGNTGSPEADTLTVGSGSAEGFTHRDGLPEIRIAGFDFPGPGSDRWTESIIFPSFTANAVVHEEQALGIIPALDLQQLRIVCSPESSLPVQLEVVALIDVSAGARSNLQ